MRVNSEAEMLELGRQFAKNLSFPAVFELIGDVGAGKTTFTRGLAEGLGVKEAVTSPSFTISKRYAFSDQNGLTSGELIHYDFYRLDNPGIMRSELSEALASPNSVIVVEWGGDVADLLPPHKVRIEFTLTSDGGRELTILNPVENSDIDCGKLVENFSELVEKTAESCGKNVEKSQKLSNQAPCELYLDTSTNICKFKINDHDYSWDSGRAMAEQIFTFIHEKLAENSFDWKDITKIVYFSGPGSFTGLRIGAAIVNALADQLQIPLFDHHGNQHPVIIPEYGRPANISAPRK